MGRNDHTTKRTVYKGPEETAIIVLTFRKPITEEVKQRKHLQRKTFRVAHTGFQKHVIVVRLEEST